MQRMQREQAAALLGIIHERQCLEVGTRVPEFQLPERLHLTRQSGSHARNEQHHRRHALGEPKRVLRILPNWVS